MNIEAGHDPASQDNPPFFEVNHASPVGGARAGVMRTGHGACETPCFMPIASHGSLRALSFEQAAACGSRIIMANGWYLYRNTGAEVLAECGGAHGHMGWDGILFTDSGGYQVFSLKDNSRITDEGVVFGTGTASDTLTPEGVTEMQTALGSDIMMALDDCAPFPCSRTRAEAAVRRTTLWAKRSMEAHRRADRLHGYRQHLYGIVQGSTLENLRRRSAEDVAALGFDGFGIGGLSIGMERAAIREMTELTCETLPQQSPRHLLGVGLPHQILEGIADGADTFDCVLPIRKGQRGVAYTRGGALYYKRPHPPQYADLPLEPRCACRTCREWSREALRRLFRTDKGAAGTLAAIHNLHFYHEVLAEARAAIRDGRFPVYKDTFLAEWSSGEQP